MHVGIFKGTIYTVFSFNIQKLTKIAEEITVVMLY